MNKYRAYGTFASSFFVLIGPASVIGKCPAIEKLGVVGWRLIDEHEQDLAFDVRAFVVVPVVFRRLDAIANVNDSRVNIGLGLLRFVVSHIFC